MWWYYKGAGFHWPTGGNCLKGWGEIIQLIHLVFDFLGSGSVENFNPWVLGKDSAIWSKSSRVKVQWYLGLVITNEELVRTYLTFSWSRFINMNMLYCSCSIFAVWRSLWYFLFKFNVYLLKLNNIIHLVGYKPKGIVLILPICN